ncbi:MAG: site-specific DNA-methyltransferase [Methanospirillum sp.]|nr:site-specific DNA-methyltransferase [Methanospirillum sp.]
MRSVAIQGGVFYNGDCIAGSQVIPDNSIDLIITDPPYGIQGDTLHRHYNRDESFVTGGYVEIRASDYERFSREWIEQAARILRPGGSIYIVSGYTNLVQILSALHQTCLEEVNHLVWRYNFGVFTSRKYVSSHYHILYYAKPGGKRTFNAECRFVFSEKNEDGRSLNYQDREDVWIINREYKPGRVKNKNELPLALLTKIIQYSSNERDMICDLFLGGFSTARAAIGLNRQVTGFELSPEMFDARIEEIAALKTGFMMDSIRVPEQENAPLTRRPWSPEEIDLLRSRYHELAVAGEKKKNITLILQSEFNRGHWSIEKTLRRAGIKPGEKQ